MKKFTFLNEISEQLEENKRLKQKLATAMVKTDTMLEFVDMQYVVYVFELSRYMQIEKMDEHDIFSELQNLHECGNNGSFVEVNIIWLMEFFASGWDENDKFDFNKIQIEDAAIDKVRYELLRMMLNKELPEKFILLIEW